MAEDDRVHLIFYIECDQTIIASNRGLPRKGNTGVLIEGCCGACDNLNFRSRALQLLACVPKTQVSNRFKDGRSHHSTFLKSLGI